MIDDISKSKSVYLFTERQLPPQSDTGKFFAWFKNRIGALKHGIQIDHMHKTLKGAKDLLTHHGLSKAYEKYCQKKVKDTLSHFLPDLPGIVNMGPSENDSSLRWELYL